MRFHAELQIEAGLDRASTGSSFIRDMTVLVLDPAAQGLEPRIVRSILERIEQACLVAHDLTCVLCTLGSTCAVRCMSVNFFCVWCGQRPFASGRATGLFAGNIRL